MDDPFVALLALDLRDSGLADHLETETWEGLMTPENLYSEHWPLAYEAARKGWLWHTNGDYVAEDPFFGQLCVEKVSFYRPPADSGVDYVTLGSSDYSG
jgi:hypothetical protein